MTFQKSHIGLKSANRPTGRNPLGSVGRVLLNQKSKAESPRKVCSRARSGEIRSGRSGEIRSGRSGDIYLAKIQRFKKPSQVHLRARLGETRPSRSGEAIDFWTAGRRRSGATKEINTWRPPDRAESAWTGRARRFLGRFERVLRQIYETYIDTYFLRVKNYVFYY